MIVSAPIFLLLVIGVIHSIRIGRLQIDFLMPAELFPVELCGASMCIAVATGLASGETEGGWAMTLATSMFVLVIAGVRLAIKLISAK